MKKYLFSAAVVPQVEGNLMFKKRATTPSSCYALGRVIYNNGAYAGVEGIGYIKDISGIVRGMEVETVDNGISFTNLPKRSGTSPVTLHSDGGHAILEEWYNRVESRSYQYMCDVVILILDSSYTHYTRCFGLKDAWVSSLSTDAMDSSKKESWGIEFTLQHSGVKAIDAGDKIEFHTLDIKDGVYSIDRRGVKRYTKATNFRCDKVADTDNNHTLFTHFFAM